MSDEALKKIEAVARDLENRQHGTGTGTRTSNADAAPVRCGCTR